MRAISVRSSVAPPDVRHDGVEPADAPLGVPQVVPELVSGRSTRDSAMSPSSRFGNGLPAPTRVT